MPQPEESGFGEFCEWFVKEYWVREHKSKYLQGLGSPFLERVTTQGFHVITMTEKEYYNSEVKPSTLVQRKTFYSYRAVKEELFDGEMGDDFWKRCDELLELCKPGEQMLWMIIRENLEEKTSETQLLFLEL